MTTLFQALVRYAVERDLLARPYYADQPVLWQLELKGDGSLVNDELVPLLREVDRKGRVSKVPGRVQVAPTINRTRGIAAILGADGFDYVLGWYDHVADNPTATEKGRRDSALRHQAWVDLMREWAASPMAKDDPIPHAVVRFLESGIDRVVPPEKWKAKDRVLIRVDGQLATESPSAASFWALHVESKKGADRRGHCVICSRFSPLVSTLPQSVKGTLIPGGRSSGVAPISINEAVYGFDLRKGLGHVPVCLSCAQAIPVALEHLLSQPNNSHRTPQAATTWWVEGGQPLDLIELLAPPTDAEVRDFIDRVASGVGTERGFDVDHFHALTLEANGPRLVVRDWTHLPLATLEANILAWFRDTRVWPLWPDGREYHSLSLLAIATGRYDRKSKQYALLSDKRGRHPHAITETLRTVALNDHPLPRNVASHVIQRIIADGHMDDARAALLRLFFSRTDAKGTVMPGLDPTNQDPCYLLGRLLAVYESMQYKAATLNGGSAPNATFADKFMAGAIASPIIVLTSGAKQAVAWRAKLRRNSAGRFFDRDIDAITCLLQQARPAPTRASIEEQASFLLGYHHQRAHDNQAAVSGAEAKRRAEAEKAEAAASEDHD